MKRLLDLVGAVLGLILLLPVILAVALAVRVSEGPPILFRQKRPGLRGEPFTLYKFRTMRPVESNEDPVETDPERLTRLGRSLRSTSLDELPELYNVLRGDMSLVGPRPLLMEYLQLYDPEQARRHQVRPGITGWAQVHGRNDLSWKEKLELDVWYVDHRSLLLDLRILMKTAWKVLGREGISRGRLATTERFRGTGDRGGA